jgi:hypothetical protein
LWLYHSSIFQWENMAITSSNQCNNLSLWWQNTLAYVELSLPLLQDYPFHSSYAEIQTHQNMVREAAYRVYDSGVPSYATELADQLIVVLWHLQSSLKAQDQDDKATSLSYFHLARVNWFVFQSMIEKHGISINNLTIRAEAAAMPVLLEY